MISREPTIHVGIADHLHNVEGVFNGQFLVNSQVLGGIFHTAIEGNTIVLTDERGCKVQGGEISCVVQGSSTFNLHDISIGIGFHWERKENQIFQGNLLFKPRNDGTFAVVNEISIEQYLTSVIASEMRAESPLEFLKAHAIISRSWIVAMREREKHVFTEPPRETQPTDEIIRWYDREDHDLYDVCADDHCQRYQGVTKIISPAVTEAVASTRGQFLVHDNQICDARFSKCCGGLTEQFESCWDDVSVQYLTSVSDSPLSHTPIKDEESAADWICSNPGVYCNTTDSALLHAVLPSFDLETKDFFRWKVEYDRRELEGILHNKSGHDFGTLMNLFPVRRGPSGRIVKLRIEGTKKTITVGKELEIRRWLSKSHLYSSAFIVEAERNAAGVPQRFVLHGAGWGHGVGLCQIGAAVVASEGKQADEILKHYFRGVELRKLY